MQSDPSLNQETPAVLLGRCLSNVMARRFALLTSPNITDAEMLLIDCEIGRLMNAANAYDPQNFEAWLHTHGDEAFASERDAFMRIASVEQQAASLIDARTPAEGPYTFGSLQALVSIIDAPEPVASERVSVAKTKRKRGGLGERSAVREPTEAVEKKKRITSKIRDHVRERVSRWRKSEDVRDLEPLLPTAQATQVSVEELIMKCFKPGPFRVSVIKAAKRMRG